MVDVQSRLRATEESAPVRILQARFHLHGDALHAPIVVGHLVWDSDELSSEPAVRPSAAFLSAGWPSTILAKLSHLIQITKPNSFSRLPALGNRLWSFVEVTAPEEECGREGESPGDAQPRS